MAWSIANLRKTLAASRTELATVALRVGAGAVGALPPIIAILFLDRAAYGHAMANQALALLLLGPVEQYLAQGYLRSLVAKQHDAGDHRPEGAGCIPAYIAICLALFTFVGPLLGLSGQDVMQTVATIVVVSLCRLQERWFIATGRQSVAIIMSYLVPPLLASLFMLSAHALAVPDEFVGVAVSLVFAYGVCAIVCFVLQPAEGRRLLVPYVPMSVRAWQREISAAGPFIVSGALASASEHLPVVLLRSFGFAATVPSFEIARKIAAVPCVILHALYIQLGTEMMRHAHLHDYGRFSAGLRKLRWYTVVIGLTYFPIATVVLFSAIAWLPQIADGIDIRVALIIFCAATTTTFTATAGAVLVALRGDRWWTLAAAVGLTVQVVISFGGVVWLGHLAIPAAIVGQAVGSSAVLVFGALRMMKARVHPQSDPVAGTAPATSEQASDPPRAGVCVPVAPRGGAR